MLLNKAYLLLRKMLFGLVKYRLHLSVIYFFLLSGNNLNVKEPLDIPLLLSLTFWHFALFLFDRIYDRAIDRISQLDEYVKYHLAKPLYWLVGLLVAASLSAYFVSGHPIFYWLILLPITFLYPLKLYKNYRVKSIFLLKNLYSALLIFVLPVYLQQQLLSTQQPDLLSFVSLGIYVLIGEIFWDIRDASADKANQTLTIPNLLGLTVTKVVLFVLMFADFWVKDFQLTSSAYVYVALLLIIDEHSDRLLFHVPPLLALLNFLL